ncbi:MAG TPA: hypothetical protein DIV79_06675 [Opitutae bacterium]|nr:hypothetical protein [Opitutaceae bacterium]HCR29681.1 hypothetical protein [Opitutae bacterium]
MARRKTANASRKSNSWKDIEQDVKAKSISETAFKRILLARCRTVALFAGAFLIAAAGLKLFVMNDDLSVSITKAGRALPVKSIIVESDALPRDWILEYLDLNEGEIDLLGLELDRLKARLEKHPQTFSAQIARQLPDTLFISVKEREPVAKMLAEDARRGRLTLLVDRFGIVYEGIGYGPKQIKSLPNLDGVRLKRNEDGFEPLVGMEPVDDLLSQTRDIAPHLYQSWKIVSLAEFPKLIVKSGFVREIVFEKGETDFRRQISRLDYIVDYYKSHAFSKVEKVDLTMNSQVPVEQSLVARR